MTYDDWKAPTRDGEPLIWPSAGSLTALATANGQRLGAASSVSIAGVPLPTLRHEARTFFGFTPDDAVIATGHQTELWHPGVWAKNALIDALARQVTGGRGRAMHLAVDTDAPKHLSVRWPYFAMPVTDDARLNTADWSGLVDPPTPAHLGEIEAALATAQQSFGYEPMLDDWIGNARRAALEGISGSDLAKLVATASHQLDWSLGLDYTINTLSPMLNARPWLAFVWHVLSRGRAFAADYNGALADYRTEQGIKSTSRPMPDLVVTDRQVEVPLWVDELGGDGRRHRATIEWRDGMGYLHQPYTDEALELDPELDAEVAVARLVDFLSRHQLRIGPRALTLTMFLRLLVADLFVHGIGGGRYDQITDRLIRAHFAGLQPPAFAVTTATLYLPQAIHRERACVTCVVQEGHHLSHQLLGERKRELVASITAAPRQSRERGELFQTMHRELRAARETDERISAWRDRLAKTKHRALEDDVVFDREVFYALQPRERLAGMIERYRAAARGG
jgi:hypothetical protein